MYYELTQEERASIIEASKPRPYLVMNGMPPISSMPTINALWEKVAARVGCPLDIRARLLGHSIASVTERYSHAEWRAWEEWTGRLMEFVYEEGRKDTIEERVK